MYSTLCCTFLCCCFSWRQCETSKNFLVTRSREEILYGVLFTFFFLLLIFTLVAASISHFLTTTVKCSFYSSNEIDLLCFFISGSSSFSDMHINVDIKIKSEEKNWLCGCFLSLKVRVAVQFTAKTCGYLKWKISPQLTRRVDIHRGAFLRAKISWMHRLPNFLTHGAALHSLNARTKKFRH